MLMLRRKVGDAVLLDGGIRIVVTEVGPGWARIGIEAPREVGVRREELVLADRPAAAP